MPTAPPICIFQGTTTFNNVSIKGSLTVADMKQIGSETGVLEPQNRSPAESVAPTYTPTLAELPQTPMSGHYLQTFYQFDKIDMFKVSHKDNSPFNDASADLAITAASIFDEIALATKFYAILGVAYIGPNSTALGQLYASFSAHLTKLPPISTGQQVLLILSAPTTPGVSPAVNQNVDIFY